MKQKLFAVTAVTLIAGCAAQSDRLPEPLLTSDFVDLRNSQAEEPMREYWYIQKRVNPGYPVSAARNDVSGCVELTVGIGEKGKMVGYLVNHSYPGETFVESTVKSIRQWQWQPAEANTQRQPVLTTIQLDYIVGENPTDPQYDEECKNK